MVVNIIANMPEDIQDALVCPSFKGPTEIDPYQLAQHSGVDTLEIIVW